MRQLPQGCAQGSRVAPGLVPTLAWVSPPPPLRAAAPRLCRSAFLRQMLNAASASLVQICCASEETDLLAGSMSHSNWFTKRCCLMASQSFVLSKTVCR